MTDSDKTRRQLVDSIRKARTGPAATGRRPAKAPAATAPGAANPDAPRPVPDPYHRGRRVWPD